MTHLLHADALAGDQLILEDTGVDIDETYSDESDAFEQEVERVIEQAHISQASVQLAADSSVADTMFHDEAVSHGDDAGSNQVAMVPAVKEPSGPVSFTKLFGDIVGDDDSIWVLAPGVLMSCDWLLMRCDEM